MSLDVLALEFTDMQLKYSKEISAFLDKASAVGQDRILIYLYKENDHILVGDLIDVVEYDYPNFHLSMNCYWCELKSEHVELKEHEDAKWLVREELATVDWLPADITLVKKIEQSRKAFP